MFTFLIKLIYGYSQVDDIPPEQHALVPAYGGGGGKRIHPLPFVDPNLPGIRIYKHNLVCVKFYLNKVLERVMLLLMKSLLTLAVQPRSMDPSKDLAAYGYGSVAWKERMEIWKQKQEKLQSTRNENAGKGDNDGDDPDLPL